LQGKCAALYGIDSNHATLKLALDKRIVDQADSDLACLSVLPQADLVILATPVLAIIDFIQKLPSLIQKSCIVLDLGSTKKDIVGAMSALPECFDPIGGHPVCGKEKLGLENADARLFQNAPFVITPLERTTLRARKAAEQVVAVAGAHLIEMDAEEHDRTLAFTSHLPFLISSVLALSTPVEYSRLTGTGFRSTSRLAGTPSHMMMGILKSNRVNILNAIQTFRTALNNFEADLQDENYIELERVLQKSRTSYLTITEN